MHEYIMWLVETWEGGHLIGFYLLAKLREQVIVNLRGISTDYSPFDYTHLDFVTVYITSCSLAFIPLPWRVPIVYGVVCLAWRH